MKLFLVGIMFAGLAANADGTITIKQVSYGVNAGAAQGNLTTKAQSFCDGKKYCQYKVENKYVDPKDVIAPGKAKDLTIEYACSAAPATILTINIPHNAYGSSIRVSCESDADVAAAIAASKPPVVAGPGMVPAAAEETKDYLESDAEFKAAKEHSGVVVIKYGAEYCGPCRMYDRDYSLIKQQLPEVSFYFVDTQRFRFEAQNGGIPQFHIYKDGVLQKVSLGYGNANGLVKTIKAAAGI